MRQNINAYTITYTPKNCTFRRRRVTEGFISFSEARTRAMQILVDKCPRIYNVAEKQFIEDGVIYYRLFAYSSRSRYSITIKSLTAVDTHALRNDFDNVLKRELKKCAETPAPAPNTSTTLTISEDSPLGKALLKAKEEYERNNR